MSENIHIKAMELCEVNQVGEQGQGGDLVTVIMISFTTKSK